MCLNFKNYAFKIKAKFLKTARLPDLKLKMNPKKSNRSKVVTLEFESVTFHRNWSVLDRRCPVSRSDLGMDKTTK